MEFGQLARVLERACCQLLDYASDQMPDGWSVTLHDGVGGDGQPLYDVWEGETLRSRVRTPEGAVEWANDLDGRTKARTKAHGEAA